MLQMFKILKVGNKLGANGLHAVVQYKNKYKLCMRSEAGWLVIQTGPVCPDVKRSMLEQVF